MPRVTNSVTLVITDGIGPALNQVLANIESMNEVLPERMADILAEEIQQAYETENYGTWPDYVGPRGPDGLTDYMRVKLFDVGHLDLMRYVSGRSVAIGGFKGAKPNTILGSFSPGSKRTALRVRHAQRVGAGFGTLRNKPVTAGLFKGLADDVAELRLHMSINYSKKRQAWGVGLSKTAFANSPHVVFHERGKNTNHPQRPFIVPGIQRTNARYTFIIDTSFDQMVRAPLRGDATPPPKVFDGRRGILSLVNLRGLKYALIPPSKAFQFLGFAADASSLVSGKLLDPSLAKLYFEAWLIGSAGFSRKKVRRKIRQRLYRGSV